MMTKDQYHEIVKWCAQNTVLGMLHPEEWQRVRQGLEFAAQCDSDEEVRSKCDCFKTIIVQLFTVTS